jgi:hypothetical protein
MNQRFTAEHLAVRSAEGISTFGGEFVVYGAWSELLFQQFYERLMPGCFDESLSGRDIIATVNHDPAMILGRVSAGTLKIVASARGLACEVSAPDTSYARDLAVSLKRGDVRGMSFTFDDVDVEWGEYQGKRSRDVVKAVLHEVSFVTLPAYDSTTAGVRSEQLGGWLTPLEMMRRIESAMLSD